MYLCGLINPTNVHLQRHTMSIDPMLAALDLRDFRTKCMYVHIPLILPQSVSFQPARDRLLKDCFLILQVPNP